MHRPCDKSGETITYYCAFENYLPLFRGRDGDLPNQPINPNATVARRERP